jgi:flagellar motor switch protein FliG
VTLALAAAHSPAAAAALARMHELKREDLEREFKDRKQLSDESAARLERVLTEALKVMAETARAKAKAD